MRRHKPVSAAALSQRGGEGEAGPLPATRSAVRGAATQPDSRWARALSEVLKRQSSSLEDPAASTNTSSLGLPATHRELGFCPCVSESKRLFINLSRSLSLLTSFLT